MLLCACFSNDAEVSAISAENQSWEHIDEYEYIITDIDLGDDGFLSTISNMEVHRSTETDEINYIVVRKGALLAFDIPKWANSRIYTVSKDDIDIVIEMLEAIRREYPEIDIDVILEKLTDRWYEYTPT